MWTTTLVRHFIYTRLGMGYCRERVRQLLHTLGFRLRRRRHRHLKAKAEEQAAFRADTKVQVYGAVAPLTGRTHYHVSPTWGKAEVAKFLRQLMADDPGKRLLVIHDRGAHHQGAAIAEVVCEARGRLVLKPQPAYAPERNPQERIWKWWRRVVTHHHWFATLREPIEAMRNFFRYLAGVKDQGRRFCGVKTPESFVASL